MARYFSIPLSGMMVFAVLSVAWAAPPDSAATSTLFKTKCASCHGPDGAGTAAGRSLNVADLRSPAVQTQSNAQLEQIIKAGKNNMPAFADSLSEPQIAGLVAHVRSFGKKKTGSAQ